MDNIKDVIQQVIGSLSKEAYQNSVNINKIWLQVIEKKYLEHTKIIGIKEDKIIVNVDSSTWLYHLKSHKITILKQLKKHNTSINDIIFRIGNI